MAKKEMSELKKRALLAKQRLKMGYWDKIHRDRIELQNKNLSEIGISELQRARLTRDLMFATDEERALREESLYRKVCEILGEDEDVLNPIGRLIDKEEYARLDERGKQKYILDLSAKFRELSRRYYLEHIGKPTDNPHSPHNKH